MKYSKTALMELTHKYRSVLKKCAFLNATILMSVALAAPANAYDHSDSIRREIKNNTATTIASYEIYNSNQSTEDGGAVKVFSGTPLTLTDVYFHNNDARVGGAVFAQGSAPLTIERSQFRNNTASGLGGAIYSNSNVDIYAYDNTIPSVDDTLSGGQNVVFSGNSANGVNNDIYMGGTSNVPLTLNLFSQAHTHRTWNTLLTEHTDTDYLDNINLTSGIDGTHYTINASSMHNSAGSSTIAMGNINGASTVNVGVNGNGNGFAVATANNITNTGVLNVHTATGAPANSSLQVAGTATLSDAVTVDKNSSLTVKKGLSAGNSITNTEGTITVGDTENVANIETTTLTNTDGSTTATGDISASGGLTNSRTATGTNATISADGKIVANALSNTKSGSAAGSATVSAGGDIEVHTDLTNTNGTVTAGKTTSEGNIYVGNKLTNTDGTITAYGDIEATTKITNTNGTITANEFGETANGDIKTAEIANTNGSITADGSIYNGIDETTQAVLSLTTLTNTHELNGDKAEVSAVDIYAATIENKNIGNSVKDATITATGDIHAATKLTNTLGNNSTNVLNASISVGRDIFAKEISNSKTWYANAAGNASINVDRDIVTEKTLENTNGIVEAGRNITVGTALSNTNYFTEAGKLSAKGDITVGTTLENVNGSITAGSAGDTTTPGTKGNIAVTGDLTNKATSLTADITAYGDITAATIENENASLKAKGYSDSDPMKAVPGNIVTASLANTNGQVEAAGDIFKGIDETTQAILSLTTLTNTRDSSLDPENPVTVDSTVSAVNIYAATLENEISGTDNGNATVTATGNIVATNLTNSNVATAGTNTAVVEATGDITVAETLTNTNATLTAGVLLDPLSFSKITAGTINNTDGAVIAAGDLVATTINNTAVNKESTGDNVATVITAGTDLSATTVTNSADARIYVGDNMYAAKTTGTTPVYTGLTLNNAGDLFVGHDIYAVTGSNSGMISSNYDNTGDPNTNTLYLLGEGNYTNTGLINRKVDIIAGKTLTTVGVTDTTALADGITGTIKNEGLLKVTSGTIVADVTGAGTLQVESGKTATIDTGVTVTQGTVMTGAEIADPATAAGVLTNNGTLNINALLDNKGEIANAGILNLNGIGDQTNAGIISGAGTLNVKTLSDKSTSVANNGLIKNVINIDAKSVLTTAAADQNDATLATVGVTNTINNAGRLLFNKDGYLLGDVTGSGDIYLKEGVAVSALPSTKIEQGNIEIKEGASLEVDAGLIKGKTLNYGDLTLRGGVSALALNQGVEGTGRTIIDDGAVSSNYLINQQLGITDDAALTIAANNIGGDVTNAGILTLTGGKLSHNLNNSTALSGTLNITDDTTVESASIYANELNIASGKTLKVGENIVNVTHAGIAGTLDIDITAAGKGESTVAGSNVTINDLTPTDGKLIVRIADNVLDAQHAETLGVDLIHGANTTFSEDQIKVVSNGDYEIKVDGGKYYIRNNDSYAETDAAKDGSGNNVSVAVAFDNAMGLEKGSIGREIQKGLNLLSKSSPAAYKKALTDLAPTDSSALTGMTQDFNNLIDTQVADRLAAGVSAGDVFEKRGAWVQALYNHSKQDKSHKTPGFSGNTAGLAFGLDGKLNKTTTVGIGYAYANSDIDSAGRNTDVESHSIFAYAQYQPSKWYVRGMLNYGLAEYKEKATIVGYSNKSKYDVDNYGARAYVGYNFDNGFTPEAGLRYTRIEHDSYTDTASQNVKTDDVNVLTGVVGVSYATVMKAKDFKWTPKAHFDLTYDLLSDRANSTVNVGTSVYNIRGEKLERFGAEMGVAAEMSVKDWDFTLGYDLGIRKDYQSHTGKLKAKYNF